MDGIELLSILTAKAPETVRLMLTGFADLEKAIEAINKGRVFRFLTKPVRRADLLEAVEAACHQYHLQTVEKELLENTLKGSIRLLTDLLTLVESDRVDNTSQLRANMRKLAAYIGGGCAVWQLELATMLRDLGAIVLPPELRQKAASGETLSPAEQAMIDQVPEMGFRFISRIPRLEVVAAIVRHQSESFASATPSGEVPPGSRMLKALNDLAYRQARGESFDDAVAEMRKKDGVYDPVVIETIKMHRIGFAVAGEEKSRRLFLRAEQLEPGDMLGGEVRTLDGKLILKAGNVLSSSSLERIRNYTVLMGIQEPIEVSRPG